MLYLLGHALQHEPIGVGRRLQRCANFCQALDQLETFFLPPALNERECQGLIKTFEYCFELGWNSLRDLLLAEGNAGEPTDA